MKSIHDILSDAFREIKEQHGVALETVDFNVMRTMAGDAHHGFIEAETVVVPPGRSHEQVIHTKTPWKLEPADSVHVISDLDVQYDVCLVRDIGNEDNEDNEANARHIVH